MAEAIPGAGPVVERVGVFVTRRPMVALVATAVATVALGFSAFGISTEFDSDDFLPSGGQTLTDSEALEEAFGGQTETVTMLVEAELTDDRTVRDLLEVNDAFDDDLTRPTGAASDITLSLGTLLLDWTRRLRRAQRQLRPPTPGRSPRTSIRASTLDPAGIQALLDRLEVLDPEGFAQVTVNDPDGTDLTLVQFDAFAGDQDRTRELVDDVEALLVRRPGPDHPHLGRRARPRGRRRHVRQPDRVDRHHGRSPP